MGGWVVVVVKKQKNLETKINKILTSSPTQSSIFILNLWWELLLTQFFFFLHLVMTLPMHPFIITFFHRRVLVPNLIYFSTLHAHAHMCLINFLVTRVTHKSLFFLSYSLTHTHTHTFFWYVLHAPLSEISTHTFIVVYSSFLII